MTAISEAIHAETEALRERIEILFPLSEQRSADIGFGRGFRAILADADAYASDFAWKRSSSMISVVNELLTLMEIAAADNARVEAEEAAWQARERENEN